MQEGVISLADMIVAFPKIEEARAIRSLLVKNGFEATMACSTGAQVLSYIDDWESGIVICGYKLQDMLYSALLECLPPGIDMLLMVSQTVIEECSESRAVCLTMPLQVHELVNTLHMMEHTISRRRRKARALQKERPEEEKALISAAKDLLMHRNHMSEAEAHRYLQKCSMDSGTNLVETAQMVLAMMK